MEDPSRNASVFAFGSGRLRGRYLQAQCRISVRSVAAWAEQRLSGQRSPFHSFPVLVTNRAVSLYIQSTACLPNLARILLPTVLR